MGIMKTTGNTKENPNSMLVDIVAHSKMFLYSSIKYNLLNFTKSSICLFSKINKMGFTLSLKIF